MKRYKDTEYFITEDGKVFRNNNQRKTRITNNGYVSIDFWINNVRKHYLLHRLVGEIFVDNPNKKPCVNHIDGNRLNNHYTNLEWVTLKENSKHSVNVLGKEVRENHSRAKVPNIIVSYIRRCRENNKEPDYERISKTYDVTITHIKNIYRGHKRKLG